MGLWRRIKLWFTSSYHITEYRGHHIMVISEGVGYSIEWYDEKKELIMHIDEWTWNDTLARIHEMEEAIDVCIELQSRDKE